MSIKRNGSQPSIKGRRRTSRQCACRSSVPGAGTGPVWRRKCQLRTRRAFRVDTHPCGQTLIVTAGLVGRSAGRAKQEIRPGDVVTARRKKHWHGATDTTAMTHIASGISERQECRVAGEGQRRAVSQLMFE